MFRERWALISSVFFLGVILSIPQFLQGRPEPYLFFQFGGWAITCGIVLVVWYAVRIDSTRPEWIQKTLPLLPVVTQVLTTLGETLRFRYDLMWTEVIYIIDITVTTSLLFYSAHSIGKYLRARVAGSLEPSKPLFDVDAIDPHLSFGAGETVQARVTRSLVYRARRAGDTSRFSLLIMLVLVLLGGGASIGLWFINDIRLIRELQIEQSGNRDMLRTLEVVGLQMRGSLAALRKATIPSSAPNEAQSAVTTTILSVDERLRSVSIRLDSITESVTARAENNNLQQALRALETSTTNWPDIANRATIAILTLFLVQIFFAVHKYSRQLESALAGKAVALELIAESPVIREALSKEMLSVAKEPLPGFGPGPRSPLDQAASLLRKAKG